MSFNKNIIFHKPLSFSDYNYLQQNVKLFYQTVEQLEESSISNFPALNIREAHERPEAMEEASVMMVGLDHERVLQGLKILEDQKTNKSRNFRKVNDYKMPNVSEKY